MTPSPKAIRHFGLAALEARARRTRQVMAPAAPAARPAAVFAYPPRRREPGGVRVRLWLPLTPLLLLLSPFPILAIPLLYLAPFRGVNWAAAVFALGRTLLALSGTDIDIQTPGAVVRLKIL